MTDGKNAIISSILEIIGLVTITFACFMLSVWAGVLIVGLLVTYLGLRMEL